MCLPPLDTQREIVAELESERKLVDANRELIARMDQKILAKLAEIGANPRRSPYEVRRGNAKIQDGAGRPATVDRRSAVGT